MILKNTVVISTYFVHDNIIPKRRYTTFYFFFNSTPNQSSSNLPRTFFRKPRHSLGPPPSQGGVVPGQTQDREPPAGDPSLGEGLGEPAVPGRLQVAGQEAVLVLQLLTRGQTGPRVLAGKRSFQDRYYAFMCYIQPIRYEVGHDTPDHVPGRCSV